MRSETLGLEPAYLNFGKARRGLAGQKAQALNLSVVLEKLFDRGLRLYGCVGGTYGYVDTDASLPSDPSGTEQGFGFGYGFGVGYRFGQRFDVTLEADRHRVKFATGDLDLEMLTLGLCIRY